jgi:hypothetical protein
MFTPFLVSFNSTIFFSIRVLPHQMSPSLYRQTAIPFSTDTTAHMTYFLQLGTA